MLSFVVHNSIIGVDTVFVEYLKFSSLSMMTPKNLVDPII